LPNDQWPELFVFLNEYIKSPQAGHREVGKNVFADRKELLVLAYWVKNVEVNRNSSS
jgi:hypothetical protein